MARILGSFLLLVIVFLIVGFAVLNPVEKVDISLGFGSFVGVPLVLALFIAFLIGSLVTFLYIFGHTIRLQLRIRQLNTRNREFEQELTAIRNIPVEVGGPGEEDTAAITTGTD